MALIKCIDCEKMISDRIENCPHCGCPVSVSVAENEKLQAEAVEKAKAKADEEKDRIEKQINTPAAKVEVNMEAELDVLYDMFTPAIINKWEIEKVGSEIIKYFDKYKEIGDFVVKIACDSLRTSFERELKAYKYAEKLKAEQLKSALDRYNYEKNKPIEGLGFGIITNSAADAVLYNVMSARNAAKQYLKNENIANQHLHDNLIGLGLDSDNLMSESSVLDFKHKIRKALEVIQEFAEQKYFMESHKDFWFYVEKYDTGFEIEGENLYSILYRGENTRVVYCNDIDEEILDKAQQQGYIRRYDYRYYGTTLKYEKEVLDALFKKENPEAYQEQQNEWDSNAEAVYNKAIEDLKNGLYYEAATALGSISGYKDAIEKSIKIWHERLLRQEKVIADSYESFALTDDGRVLTAGSVKPEHKEKIEQWQGVESIYSSNGLVGLTFDGTLLGVNTILYGSYGEEYKACSISKLKKLKAFEGRFTYIAIKDDGSIIALGKNENGICDNAEKYSGIDKASVRSTENIAFLTKDGEVLSIGSNYSGCEEWKDVVDIVSDYAGLLGLKKDGTVYFSEKPTEMDPFWAARRKFYGTHPSEWKDVYKYFGDRIAIDKYGRVYGYGTDDNYLKFDGLKDVVYMINETHFKAYIKADGTIHEIYSRINIPLWNDIVSIYGGYDYVIGLKKDGTFVCEGEFKSKEDILKWRLFEDVNKRVDIKDEYIRNKRAANEKELVECKNELSNLKGLFAGKRRKELETRIAELEEDLK